MKSVQNYLKEDDAQNIPEWKKKINVDDVADVIVEIPKEAENITFFKIVVFVCILLQFVSQIFTKGSALLAPTHTIPVCPKVFIFSSLNITKAKSGSLAPLK